MNLAKALKQKNRLAGEIARLRQLLGAQNSRPSTQKFDYDNKQVLAELRARIDELVVVKAGIAVANAAIYGRIFRLAELKGLIDALQRLDTRSGVFKEAAMFGHAPIETEFIAQICKTQTATCKAQASSAECRRFQLSETAACSTFRPVIEERTPLSRTTSRLPQFFKGTLSYE